MSNANGLAARAQAFVPELHDEDPTARMRYWACFGWLAAAFGLRGGGPWASAEEPELRAALVGFGTILGETPTAMPDLERRIIQVGGFPFSVKKIRDLPSGTRSLIEGILDAAVIEDESFPGVRIKGSKNDWTALFRATHGSR